MLSEGEGIHPQGMYITVPRTYRMQRHCAVCGFLHKLQGFMVLVITVYRGEGGGGEGGRGGGGGGGVKGRSGEDP